MGSADDRRGMNPSDRVGAGEPGASPGGLRLFFTGRIAGWSARHRWCVLGATVVVIVLAIFVLATVETKERPDDDGVGESGRAYELIDERFSGSDIPPPVEEPRRHSRRESLIFSNPSLEVGDPLFRSTVEDTIARLLALPQVTSAVSFYDTDDPGMISSDDRAVLGQVIIEADTHDDLDPEAVLDTVRSASRAADGFEMGVFSNRLIEDQADDIIAEDFQRILIISLVAGLIILLLAFRAVVAAIIPLVLAVGAIFSALAVAALVSHVYALVELYAEMILMMGLAVGIDYSLFVLSRFRRERAAGRPKLEAITVASNTTGRAVFFAGITVVLSLAGLFVVQQEVFTSLALGAIIVVLIAVIGSLTLLPALLAVLGDSINRLRVPYIGRDVGRTAESGGVWGAITDKVLARPAVLATVATGALVALAVPFFYLSLGFNEGADALPDALESKRPVELLEQHFSSSLIKPARIVVDAPDVNSPEIGAATDSLARQIEQSDDFIGSLNIESNQAGNLLEIEVVMAGNIDDDQSEDAIRQLRREILPQAFKGTGARVLVTGATAEGIDFRDHMNGKSPYVFSFVLGLAFLLMLIMFRSIVIPIKAIVLNLLSVGAAYGVLVMVFQWGWGIGLLGSEKTGIIEVWLPLFLFAILFGLSMDYHMLLLNRIKEAYDQGRSNEESVSVGVKVTAGQITSAAAIMVAVFAAFATSRILGLQQFGVGLAVAVFIDATVIRSILLPATMKLLGEANWYLPSWLDWLPKVSTEPEHGEPTPQSGD